MLNRKKIELIACMVIIMTTVGAIVALRNQRPTSANEAQARQQPVDASQFPIVDLSSPRPTNQSERALRARRERKYGRYRDNIGPGIVHASVMHHWPPGFSTIPVAQSDAVIIGEIIDVKAYITSDESSVYSEFTLQVSEILKNDNHAPISIGGQVLAERPGGRVRFPSGGVSWFSVEGWGMPQLGHRYVLFLSRNSQDETYRILTGYELRGNQVIPLDRTTSSETNFDMHAGSDQESFINKVRAAVTNPH